jgi:hypothetical protein
MKSKKKRDALTEFILINEDREQDSFEFTIEECPLGDYIEFFQGWECLNEMQKALYNVTSQY